ncbi:hypothetical protein BaRGS_00024413 [Batillaria attramentaria]|uniref:Uncharacterized protein n=1 Tax=Batillaria attramentaria TaxID=370345 RepID=A0ABD0KB12_9CAEN
MAHIQTTKSQRNGTGQARENKWSGQERGESQSSARRENPISIMLLREESIAVGDKLTDTGRGLSLAEFPCKDSPASCSSRLPEYIRLIRRQEVGITHACDTPMTSITPGHEVYGVWWRQPKATISSKDIVCCC